MSYEEGINCHHCVCYSDGHNYHGISIPDRRSKQNSFVVLICAISGNKDYSLFIINQSQVKTMEVLNHSNTISYET